MTTSDAGAAPGRVDGPVIVDDDRRRGRGADHDARAATSLEDDHRRAADDGDADHRAPGPHWSPTDHGPATHGAAHDGGTAVNAETGTATWYEGGTASGCAHHTLPKGTVVTVTAIPRAGRSPARSDDRGPFGSHIIDLSPSGFQALAPLSAGVVIDVTSPGEPARG